MGLLSKLTEKLKDFVARADAISRVGTLPPEIVELTLEIDRMRGISRSPAELEKLFGFLTNDITNAAALGVLMPHKERLAPYETEIKKIIFSATNSHEETDTSRMIRHYIWDPRNDPEAAVELLKSYADLTDKVMDKVRSSKHHSGGRKLARQVGEENLFETENEYFTVARNYAWELGPDYIEEALKEILWRAYSRSLEERLKYPRIVRHLFGAKEKNGQAPSSYSPPELKEFSKDRKAGDDALPEPEKIIPALRKISAQEVLIREALQKDIENLSASVRVLSSEFSMQCGEARTAADMHEEQRLLAKRMLDEKNELLRKIEAEGGTADGYETPAEILTLIATERAKTDMAEEPVFLGSHEASIPDAQALARHIQKEDIGLIMGNVKDREAEEIFHEIISRRGENSRLQAERKSAEHEAFHLQRKLDRKLLETEKTASRMVALEMAGRRLMRDIEDLREDSESDAVPSRTEGYNYPPLSELKDWAEANLKNRVRIHRDAFNEAARLSDTHRHPEWIYQGLELLANEYWEQATSGNKSPETARSLRAEFTRHLDELHMRIGGSITDLKGTKIRSQYQTSFDAERLFLDQHLRRGVSRNQNNILCIYFAWKPETKQVMVGHLPTHLECSR